MNTSVLTFAGVVVTAFVAVFGTLWSTRRFGPASEALLTDAANGLIDRITTRLDKVEEENARLLAITVELRQENMALRGEVLTLRTENTAVLAELATLRHSLQAYEDTHGPLDP